MNIAFKVFSYIVVLLGILAIVCLVWPISDDLSRFTGSVESFKFTMEKSDGTTFKAKEIGFLSDRITYYKTKNISIHYGNGSAIKKEDLLGIDVIYNGEYPQTIADAEVSISSKSTTINKNDMLKIFTYYGELNAVDGNTVALTPNENKIRIYRGNVDSVMIESENITNFSFIDFEMSDNPYSHVGFDTDNITLTIYDVSKFSSSGQLSKMMIRRGEGVLGIGNHKFDIENNDILDIEIAEVGGSLLSVDNNDMEFDGIANSAKLNNKNILINYPTYVLKFKPEKINAYATLLLSIITILYVVFTGQTVEESKKERSVSFIMKRLEEFYYPLDELLKTYVHVVEPKNDNTDEPERELRIRATLRQRESRIQIENYQDIINHQYLAENDTKVILDKFLATNISKARTTEKEDLNRYDKLVALIKNDIVKLRNDLEKLRNIKQ